MAVVVFLVLPYTAFCFSRQVDLGLLTGWRGHLKIDRFFARTPALGPREAQVHNQVLPGHNGSTSCTFYSIRCLKQCHFIPGRSISFTWRRWPSTFEAFYAGNAALGSNEPHNGNRTWLRVLRRGCVRFVLLLAPYLPSFMPGRWPCGLCARWVGALVKRTVPLPVTYAN